MENWINSISLPDDSGDKEPMQKPEPWIDHIDLPDDSGWIDHIDLPDDSGIITPQKKSDDNGREHANDLRRRRIM